MPLEIHAIGNIEANSTVNVKSQVSGQLQQVYFIEGQDVRKDQLLFLIDPRQFQQAVSEAEAALANAHAAVGQAEANYQRDLAQAQNAKATASRYAGLAAKGIISREANENYLTQAEAADRVHELKTMDDVKFLDVRLNLLNTWHIDGLQCIGDAAHAMSPIGGVGINLELRQSYLSGGSATAAFGIFVSCYLGMLALTWMRYVRRTARAELPAAAELART